MRCHAAHLNIHVAIVGVLCAFLARAVVGAPETSANTQEAAIEHFEFDIPAQPLVDALRLYASLTHQPTLFPSDLVSGRSSTAIRGMYSPEAALHRLLAGTGLTAEKSGEGSRAGFLLKAIDSSIAAPRASLGELTGYPGLIQARVWDALCADARTTPGEYRSLLRFEVDANGQVQRPRLLSSTGDTQRDAALLTVLERVRMDDPPPPDLSQPVTMLIVPRDAQSADSAHCRVGVR